MTKLKDIDQFLSLKRFAVAGVSRNPKDFSRMLFHEFRKRGYDAVPVNPAVTEVEGVPCFASVSEVQPPVSAVLMMTTPTVTEEVARDCVAAGVEAVWMYRAVGSGAISAAASAYCKEKGIRVIEGECPFMFLPHTALLPHGLHGYCKKLFGSYPS